MGDRGGMSAAACRLSVEAVVMEYRDQGQEPPAGVPRKVLVMDDDRMFCEMAAELLQHLGCELVETARGGEEAVEKFHQAQAGGAPFDLVILDLTVYTGRGGKEIINDLIQLDPGVKAIITSGYGSDPVMVDHAAFGFFGALRKPFRVAELKLLLRRAATLLPAAPGGCRRP